MIQFLHFQLKETFWPTFKNQIFDDDSIDSSFQQSQYDLYDFSDSKQQINDSKVYNENNSYNHFSKNNENLLEINQSQILKPQKNYSNLTITDNKENLYFLNKPMKNWSTIECYEWIQSWGFNDEIIDLIKNIGMDGAELIELTPKKMQLQLKIQDIDIQTKLLSLIHYTNFKILNQKK